MPTVSGTVTDAQGNTANWSASWTVSTGSTFKSFPGAKVKPIIGMSAPANLWDQRAAEVGPGLGARRIFADFTASGTDQSNLIESAIADGLLPVVSYKGNPTTAQLTAAANYLGSLGVPIAVLCWHEPRGDTALGSTTAAQQATWRSIQAKASPVFRAKSNLSFGCIVNGFLIDTNNGKTELMGWLPDADLNGNIYDWLGSDFYQTTPDQLGNTAHPWAGDRKRAFVAWLKGRGFGQYRMLCGEYNGWIGAAVADAGEAVLSDPVWWLSCVFNSVGGAKGEPLTHDPTYGDRLGAFQDTLADPRKA